MSVLPGDKHPSDPLVFLRGGQRMLREGRNVVWRTGALHLRPAGDPDPQINICPFRAKSSLMASVQKQHALSPSAGLITY